MRVAHQLRTAAAGVPMTWPPRPRVLYFDIDGTLVQPTFGRAKTALADGRFERLVRRARFDRLVCVSDAVLLARALACSRPAAGPGEAHRILWRFCRGTVEDPRWFEQHVELAQDPLRRAEEIDVEADWFYADDNAYRYLASARRLRSGVLERTLLCDSRSEGHELATWLQQLAQATPPGGGTARYAWPSPERWSYARRRE